MPKDKVEAAIKRASGQGAAVYEEILYEGYAPHGVAVLVEAATDNPTRTVAGLRSKFSHAGGALGSSGSVAFGFKRMGVFRLAPEGIDAESLELDLIDHGLDEMGEGRGEKERGITPVSAELEYIALNPVHLPEDQATEALELVDLLEQEDDVQKVFHNLG